MMLLCACENYLDLTPKGATLLDNLTEIEYLLNGNYTNSAYEFEDLYVMTVMVKWPILLRCWPIISA